MGPCSSLQDRPATYFAPGPYKAPQRKHPALVNASTFKAELDRQVESFRRKA